MNIRTVGIDPGLSGAVAILLDGRIDEILDMPTVEITRGKKGQKRTAVDLQGVISLFERLRILMAPSIIVLEKVSGRPTDAGSRAFTFGETYGIIRTVLTMLEICRLERIEPNTWKRHMKVGTLNGDIDLRAQELFPGQHQHWHGPRGGLLDGRAEAAMLGLYGKWILEGVVPEAKLAHARRSK